MRHAQKKENYTQYKQTKKYEVSFFYISHNTFENNKEFGTTFNFSQFFFFRSSFHSALFSIFSFIALKEGGIVCLFVS